MKGSLLTSMSFFLLFSSWLLVVLKPGHAQEMLANAKCNDYPDRGTCEDRGFTVKWYYDRFSHRCREFYYGGCGGNNNRFDSFEDCTNECHFEVGIDMIADIRCHLPHDPGNCWGDFQRWSFDSNLKKCVCSTWSGCGGNANRFYSYEHCMSICGRFTNRDASSTSPSPEQLRTAHNIFSEMNKQRRRFFTAAPVQVIPISYRNLFVNGNGNQTYESGRTIFTGLPPAAIYTRILPSSSTRRVWHIRGDAQVLPNGTLSTKELFRIQQVLRNNQLRSQNDNVVPHYRSPRTKATNKRVSADRMTSSPSSSAAVLSSSSQTSNDGSLTDQQRAHLEQRKWRHYTQEQARIREENYRRQLEAIRNRQEALNLYRYNQQYPVRGRSHTTLSSTSSGSSRPQNQPSQERNIDTPTKQKYSSSVQLLLRTQPYQEDNRTPKLRARYESPIPSDDRGSGRNVVDSEVARHSNMQTESIGKSEQHFRQTQSTDITNETPRRAEPQANQERPQGTAQVMGSNSALHSTSYDDRQLEYYRQLQEHRRRYLEQIRERQLREREAELRRREYLIRTQSMSEKARALALERLKQQRQIELQSSAASSASASSSLPSSQFAVDKQQSHSESHINTLSHHPKAQSIQASHQQPKPLSRQEQFQPQRETSTSNHLGRQQSAYGKNIGSWLDSDSQRSYLKQHIHVHQPLPTTTTTTTATTTTTTATTTTTKMSTPMPRPSGDSEDRRTEDEIRRALTKARKRARLENLKKLERMMGLASSSEVDYDETTKTTPAPSLRTSSSTVPTTVSIIATTTTTPAPIRQRLEMDSDRILGHSKTDHSWSTFSNRNRSPGLSGATQRMSTSKASGKLNGDVKKSAEKVMQDEEGEIISEHIISAQKKEEPMNVGKQIISLDDYDDENEMIEEEYDVDEYGKRITNNQNNRTMIISNQHDGKVLVTSPDPQLEPYFGYLPNISLLDDHLTVGESNNASLEIITLSPPHQKTHELSKQQDSDWSQNKITTSSTTGSSESIRAYNFTSNSNLDVNKTDESYATVAERTTSTAIASTSVPVNVAEQGDLIILEHSPDETLKLHNGSMHMKHGELTGEDREDSNGSRENTTSLHSDMKEDYNDPDEDLFFWRPEYENKRLQMIVRDNRTDDEGDMASQSENAFRIKIHNREVLVK